MKQNTKTTVTSLLFLSLLAGSIAMAGCGDTTAENPVSSSPSGTEQPVSEAVTEAVPAYDFGGADYKMLLREEFSYEFDVASSTGDLVEDAVYKRNLAVCEDLNVNISTVGVPGNYGTRDVFIGAVRDSVMANDQSYDVVAGAANYSLSMGTEGLLENLLDIEELKLDQPWWSSGFNDAMTIHNALYYTTGSISLNSLENMIVFMFNKKLCADYGITEPYADVKDGTWTFEAMMEMANKVSGDLNGNGKQDKEDMYGYLLYTNTVKTMLIGFDIPMTTRTAEGGLEMTFLNDRTVSVAEAVTAAIHDNPSVFYHEYETDTLTTIASMQNMFAEAHVLFMPQVLSTVSVLRSMDVDFGILPFPKYDAAQKDYRTPVQANVTAFAIPKNGADLSRTAIVTETLAEYSHETVLPAYFDVALKTKYARDEDSAEMLDLITSHSAYDFAYINSDDLSGIVEMFHTVVYGKKDLTSAYEKERVKIEKALADLTAQSNG